MVKKVETSQAAGARLAHDMTKIIPGQYKGARFTRGHTVAPEDIPELLRMGKEHVYVMDDGEDTGIHEEEAARRLASAISGINTQSAKPSEGRINILATGPGLLKVDVDRLYEINSIPGISVSTMHNNSRVEKGNMIAGVKVIPLYIEEEKIAQVEKIASAGNKLLNVKPYTVKKVAIVVTGNEVYKGLVQDKFVDVMRSKVEPLGASVFATVIAPDDAAVIAARLIEMKNKGAELIIVCGGLSVDPDDVTLEGVIASGARLINYGAPVMPGAMVLLAILDGIPVLGAPAGSLFNVNIVDVLLPRLLAGEMVSREEIIAAGHGGLCLKCPVCNYPVCPFCA